MTIRYETFAEMLEAIDDGDLQSELMHFEFLQDGVFITHGDERVKIEEAGWSDGKYLAEALIRREGFSVEVE